MFRRRTPRPNEAKLFIESVHRRLLNGKPDPITRTRIRTPPSSATLLHGDLELSHHHEGKPKKMQVLCFGHSRTGTLSLMAALQQLGYTPYHMTIAMDYPSRDLPLWIDALEAKYEGKEKPWGREEFEKVLGDFDAVLDIPCIYFAEELLQLYPEAKVIITDRDVDEWLTSISRTVGHVLRYRLWPLIAPFDPALTHPWYSIMRYTDVHLSHWTDACTPYTASKAREAYKMHYARLAQIVPPEKVLHLRCGGGKWNELCEFLGLEMPKGQYPKLNDSEFYVAFHDAMWWRSLELAIRTVGGWVLAVVAVIMLMMWFVGSRAFEAW